MPAQRLKQFLDENGVKYVTITHSPAYTAAEIAHSAHIPGKDLAKTVIVALDGKMTMAVLPANCQIDFDRLKKASGASKAQLAAEGKFQDAFPGCELGAMPPFGNLYGIDVLVAKPLSENEEIAFNAESHTELIKLAYKDFERLVSPKVVEI